MGYFHNILNTSSPSRRSVLGLAVCLVMLLTAALATAEPTVKARVASDERAVSTSPFSTDISDPPTPGLGQPTDPLHRPLTRAASQQRIDSISPLRWLAGYGSVDVSRRD